MKRTRISASIALAATLLVAGFSTAQAQTEQAQTLTLKRSVVLPEITKGDFDHFAVDFLHNRLYSSAQGTHTIEVFDLSSGEHLRSVGGLDKNHSIFFAPSQNEILIVDGGSETNAPAVKAINADTMQVERTYSVGTGPDAAYFDEKSHRLYVKSGGKANKPQPMATSVLHVIDVDAHKEIAHDTIDSDNIEGMVADDRTGTLFMNLRDKKTVALFDLKTNKFIKSWEIPGLNQNTPIGLDAKNHRLFVVGRAPGKLFVINSDNGQLLSTADVADISDDMTYDPHGDRIFVSADKGFTVLARVDKDHFAPVQINDQVGGKSSVYVPKLKQFYIGRTAEEGHPTSLDVYTVSSKN
ncbi:DNA-binding beta-propeller fold protein YncE [Paraburkholderia sp. WC7.3g]|uniref:YncE family protein n=1 Tax=Paraburkholderia sp. WC7.3g TaxID=2991070 RepID=UPI003D197E08